MTITIFIASFLSTLSLRRATAKHFSTLHNILISIHALLAESDCTASITPAPSRNFYPRSPCGERRQQPDGTTSTTYFYPRSPCGERLANLARNQHQRKFLSTLSLRRATPYIYVLVNTFFNFYPRSPCGERRAGHISKTRSKNFYPRSPCGERRPPSITPTARRNFYPRSPCGERPSANVKPSP